MKKEIAKEKYKNGEIQICYDVDNVELLNYISNFDYKGVLGRFYYKDSFGRVSETTIKKGLPIVKLSEIEEEFVWLGSEMQIQMYENGEWLNCESNHKYRLKPNPDFSKEIDALQAKAKENNMRAVIAFENI